MAYITKSFFVKATTELGKYLLDLSIKSNNLYNTANYYIRQVMLALKREVPFINEQEVLDIIKENLPKMNKIRAKSPSPHFFEMPTKENWFLNFLFLDALFRVSDNKNYRAVPGQVNQYILKRVVENWESYFKANIEYKEHPEKFSGKPRIPHYKKSGGKNIVYLTNIVCKLKKYNDNENTYLRFPKTDLKLNLGTYIDSEAKLKEVQIIPVYKGFDIKVILEEKDKKVSFKEPSKILGIDLGIDNFITMSNNVGIPPHIVKGKDMKSYNKYFNKKLSSYMSITKKRNDKSTSNKIHKLYDKRRKYFYIKLHSISNYVINYCLNNNIDTIVIGKNDNWKVNSNLGKVNNQTFVQIPYELFINDLEYKCKINGINFFKVEESYTSKASFLDMDKIPIYGKGSKELCAFSGKRICRGLYKSKSGMLINADINGASNIIRKKFKDAFNNMDLKYLLNPIVVKNVNSNT